MSIMLGHIKAARAIAEACDDEANARAEIGVKAMMSAFANVFSRAADAMEAGELAQIQAANCSLAADRPSD